MTNQENEVTMPAPGGQELNIRQHVAQSTLCHPDWTELDHQYYLISEVGFEPEYVREQVQAIIHQMIETRGAQDRRPELPWLR